MSATTSPEMSGAAALAPASAPDVSFALACYNALPYLDAAVASALAQTDVSVEVLIVDDHSTDGSFERAQELASKDARIRVFRTARNSGPGGARNVALGEMRGTWYAVLDSDDLVEPGRSRALIDLAETAGADLVADNLTVFGDDRADRTMFPPAGDADWYWLGLEDYFTRSHTLSGAPGPGFLKPMIRRSVVARTDLRYDETLRIGEDDELIVRLLESGCRYAVSHCAHYRYRKHGNSISHRLSLDHAERMMKAERRIRTLIGPDLASGPAYTGRYRAMRRALAFTRSIDALQQRQPVAALTALARYPSAALLYRTPIAARLRRLFR